jgi:hypothetical protein
MIGKLRAGVLYMFTGRWPSGQGILRTYGVIVFLLYSWTLLASFYKLPSWMYFLDLYDILSIYAYSFSANLLESLVLMAGALLLEYTIFLPFRDREGFQSRSVIMVIVVLACIMTRLILYRSPEKSMAFLQWEWVWWSLSLVGGYVMALRAPRSRFLKSLIDGLAERTVVFVYIYIPLSLLALLMVLIRNISWVVS